MTISIANSQHNHSFEMLSSKENVWGDFDKNALQASTKKIEEIAVAATPNDAPFLCGRTHSLPCDVSYIKTGNKVDYFYHSNEIVGQGSIKLVKLLMSSSGEKFKCSIIRLSKNKPLYESHLKRVLNERHVAKLGPQESDGVVPYILFYQLSLVEKNETIFHIVQPYYSCSLHDLIEERALTIYEITLIANEVLGGIDWFHNHHLVHHDIKPENILLRMQQGAVVGAKVSDCDLVVQENTPDALMCGGSFYFLAPEIFQRMISRETPSKEGSWYSLLNRKIDIWSFGATMGTMMARRLPPWMPNQDVTSFASINFKIILAEMYAHTLITEPDGQIFGVPTNAPPHLIAMTRMCLTMDPRFRPSVPQIREFLSSQNPSKRKHEFKQPPAKSTLRISLSQ